MQAAAGVLQQDAVQLEVTAHMHRVPMERLASLSCYPGDGGLQHATLSSATAAWTVSLESCAALGSMLPHPPYGFWHAARPWHKVVHVSNRYLGWTPLYHSTYTQRTSSTPRPLDSRNQLSPTTQATEHMAPQPLIIRYQGVTTDDPTSTRAFVSPRKGTLATASLGKTAWQTKPF